MEIGIVGLGLVGGSLARDLAAAGRTVLATDLDPGHLAAARDEGVVSGVLDPDAPPDTVVIAVPVGATPDWIRRFADLPRPPSVVTDVGSTKRSAVKAARDAGLDGFVGSHPVAGSHESGWGASRTGLFRDAVVWVCAPADPGAHADADTRAGDREGANGTAVAAVERLWRDIGARPVRVDAARHDHLLARSSHLPQVAASALGLALHRLGIPAGELGPGGRDTSRLAGSDPAMWSDILVDNADEVGPALAAFAAELDRLAGAIARRDAAAIRAALAGARNWKTSP